MPVVRQRNYCLTGEFLTSIRDSPSLKVLKKGFEVVLLVDSISKYATFQLKDFHGKKLVCTSSEGLEIEEMAEEKKHREEAMSLHECFLG
jgi:molecular chaperone HtpG